MREGKDSNLEQFSNTDNTKHLDHFIKMKEIDPTQGSFPMEEWAEHDLEWDDSSREGINEDNSNEEIDESQ